MSRIILILIGIAIGIFLVWLFQKRRKNREAVPHHIQELNMKAQEEKEDRKQEIMSLLRKQREITNDDVENMFDVSHATATNYLTELEQEGKITQYGDVGRNVFYKAK